jgi:hypothetical protein
MQLIVNWSTQAQLRSLAGPHARCHAGGGKKAPPIRSFVEQAKAKRAKARRGSRAPARDRRRARTQAEVDKLGEAHLAWKRPDGTGYSFPCEDEAGVKNAVIAVNRARPAWRPGIRKFIMRRARALKCEALIPPTWMASGALEGEPGPRPPAYA